MANVKRFIPKVDRIRADAAERIFEHLSLIPDEDLPARARAEVLNALHRRVHDDREEAIWPGGFVMISREQTAAIWKAIRALPPELRPGHVRHAFDLVLLNLRQDNGEVMLTRDQFADEIGCTPDHVSDIMGTLDRMGVIRRERRKVAGMRGRGMVVYFVNPHVAWNGSLDGRRREAAPVAQPSLRLVGGGASPAASPPA